jgi:hypothetical protein
MPSVAFVIFMRSVTMPHSIMLCNMLSVIMLSVIMLSVIILSVIMLSVNMLSVSMLSVILLNVIMLSVAEPESHPVANVIKLFTVVTYDFS